MKIYVEIDELLDLFGDSDWEIEAKETIRDAWHNHEFLTISFSDEETQTTEENN